MLGLVVVEDDRPAAPLPKRKYRRAGQATPIVCIAANTACSVVETASTLHPKEE